MTRTSPRILLSFLFSFKLIFNQYDFESPSLDFVTTEAHEIFFSFPYFQFILNVGYKKKSSASGWKGGVVTITPLSVISLLVVHSFFIRTIVLNEKTRIFPLCILVKTVYYYPKKKKQDSYCILSVVACNPFTVLIFKINFL